MAQDYTAMPSAVGAVMAHEMGHNFGFFHYDNETAWGPCDCDATDPAHCIMHSEVRLVVLGRILRNTTSTPL